MREGGPALPRRVDLLLVSEFTLHRAGARQPRGSLGQPWARPGHEEPERPRRLLPHRAREPAQLRSSQGRSRVSSTPPYPVDRPPPSIDPTLATLQVLNLAIERLGELTDTKIEALPNELVKADDAI